MSDINDLCKKFSIPGVVSIEPGHGGLPRIAVTSEQAEAQVYLHGAHVTHYRPRAAQDLLFLSTKSKFEAAKAIRGGIPLIFPWFGPKSGDDKAPPHGFARTTAWDLKDVHRTADGSVVLTLELVSSDATRKLWPHDFSLQYTIIVGSSLELSLEVRSLSNAPFNFEEALHTYLAVDEVRNVSIEGLGGREFLDKMDSGKRKTEGASKIRITAETDRVYMNTPDTVTVTDSRLARQVIIEKQGSQATVLWNPWIAKATAMADFGNEEWPEMLCVETANVGENAVTLGPGQTHRMSARIAWSPASTEKGSRSSVKQWEMSSSTGRDRS